MNSCEYFAFSQVEWGGLFVASEISRDAGVKSETVSDWISFVERMMYLIHVPAYSSSITTRLVKAPRYYFSDIAIATRLQGWNSEEPLMVSPYLGGLFENAVASEIIKAKQNYGWELNLFHWRTKDDEEVDFIVQSEDKLWAIECKYSATEANGWVPPKTIRKLPNCEFAVVSATGGPSKAGIRHLSLRELSGHLKTMLKQK